MKRLVLAMIILGISTTVGSVHAQEVNPNNERKPFVAEFSRLSAYLDLAPYQVTDVYHINEYFIRQQKKSLNQEPERRDEQLQKIVYGNLKLMKKALTDEQYRKYVVLLNVTNNNNRMMGDITFGDVYLAGNE